jgi:hypothetical protein
VSHFNHASTSEESSLAIAPTVCSNSSYWLLPEAMHLFKPIGQETMLKAISNQIALLGNANDGETGYLEVIADTTMLNCKDLPTYQVSASNSVVCFLRWPFSMQKKT